MFVGLKTAITSKLTGDLDGFWGPLWEAIAPRLTPKKQMAVGQNLVPLVNIKIAGKWMFIPLKMVLIGIDPYPNDIANETCAIVCHPRHKKKWGLVMSIF